MNNNNYTGWKDQLQVLINQHNRLRIDGKPASGVTQEERAKFLFKFMTDIRAMGYKVEPSNIREKHVQAMCNKFEADQLSASTIQTYISFLRAFCLWINKPGLIGDVKKYFNNPTILERKYAATRDKSWDVSNLDKVAIFNDIKANYPYVWMQMLFQDAFGLRRKEAIMLRPITNAKDGVLHITEGAKGGKVRTISIDSDYQREVIRQAQLFTGKKAEHLGEPKKTLEQNMTKYSNVMHRHGIKKSGLNALGITGHGLRVGFAIREMEKRGLVPLIRGGKLGSLPKDEEIKIRLEVSRLLGHNRMEVMAAYGGAFTTRGLDKITVAMTKALVNALTTLQVSQECEFTSMEFETPDGQLFPENTMARTFLGMIDINGAAYLEVERNDDGKRHTIAVGVLTKIDFVMEPDLL